MTPAIKKLKNSKIDYKLHRYTHDNRSQSYGLEAVEKLGFDKNRVFKTLVCSNNEKSLLVALVPVSSLLNLKLLAKATNSKKVSLADVEEVEKSTGYILGGVSPLGQKRKLLTIIDESAKNYETIFVSGGRRGLEIELSPLDLLRSVDGKFDVIIS